MRTPLVATLTFALGFASALAITQAISQTATPGTGQLSSGDAPGTDRSITGDRRMDALVFGLASVSVDTEAAIIRINTLEDRLDAMEKRLIEVESRVTR